MSDMEGSPFNLFGDPDEFRARMEELSEQMQSSQRVAWADNAIKLAVEMTVASIGRLDLAGSADEQAMQVRDAIRVLFPEAVTLVREAREGLALRPPDTAHFGVLSRPNSAADAYPVRSGRRAELGGNDPICTQVSPRAQPSDFDHTQSGVNVGCVDRSPSRGVLRGVEVRAPERTGYASALLFGLPASLNCLVRLPQDSFKAARGAARLRRRGR